MTKPIRVLLADDHTLVRSTLADRLDREPDLEVVGCGANADDAVGLAIVHQPDVVLLDIDMPGLSSFDAARAIRMRVPTATIVFLSAFAHDRYIDEALALQSRGYVTKSETPEQLVEAVRVVARGGVYLSPDVRERIVVDEEGHLRVNGRGSTRTSLLTPREIEVLRYIARGMSQKEIAATMNVSPKTVSFHSTSLMKKLDIHDRVELARYAIREGLAKP